MRLCEVDFWDIRLAGAATNVARLDIVGIIMLGSIDWRRPHAIRFFWTARRRMEAIDFAKNGSRAGEGKSLERRQ